MVSESLRILVVGMGSPPETFLDRLFTGLVQRRHVITIMSGRRPDQLWARPRGIAWVRGPAKPTPRRLARGWLSPTSGPRRRGLLRDLRAARTPLDVGGYDVIYVPWISTLTGHPELFDHGIPVVASCRGYLVSIAPLSPRRRSYADQLPNVFDSVAGVHCVSEAIQDDAKGLGLDPIKSVVIRPAVVPQDFAVQGISGCPGRLRLLAVGSMSWVKSYETAIKAVALAVERGVDVGLDVIGEGPLRSQLEFAVDDLGVGDRVRLLGRRKPEEVAKALAGADAFIHTSVSEGISNAVLEAMASGLPVITANVGGMAEAVRDGIDGFLVDVRDVQIIADRIWELAADPDLRFKMGTAARTRIEADFDIADQIDAFEQLFRKVAKR